MRRKAAWLVTAALIMGAVAVFAQGDDVKQHPSCKYCGMDREKFGHSRMLIEYDDGTSVGTCSMHCAAVELALNMDRTPKAIRAADYGTRRLIDAEKAFWTVGGNKPGVMTRRAKWAFEKKEDADRYAKEQSALLSSFEEAVKASFEEMYQDSKMIREKRRMMKTGGGEHQHQMQHQH